MHTLYLFTILCLDLLTGNELAESPDCEGRESARAIAGISFASTGWPIRPRV
jgi:hypothetical protein